MTHDVVRHADAQRFLDRAMPWLLQQEAKHNLILGVAGEFVGARAMDPPPYFATLETASEVAGCTLYNPGYRLILTQADAAFLEPLIEELLERYGELPGVNAPEPTAGHFAALWTARTGLAAQHGRNVRVFELTRVEPPPRRPPGRLRQATASDQDRVVGWFQDFLVDAGMILPDVAGLALVRLRQGAVFLWDDGVEACAMAAWSGRTPNGVRVNFVYTPASHRGRGYASALVADLSQRLLDAGHRFCFLFTDLANPTSNSIYQKLGYRPKGDSCEYDFARR